jgi:hypothetical protein
MEAVQGTDAAGWSDDELESELRAAQIRVEQVAKLKTRSADRRRVAVVEAARRDWTTYRVARLMKADPGTVRAVLDAAQKQEPQS